MECAFLLLLTGWMRGNRFKLPDGTLGFVKGLTHHCMQITVACSRQGSFRCCRWQRSVSGGGTLEQRSEEGGRFMLPHSISPPKMLFLWQPRIPNIQKLVQSRAVVDMEMVVRFFFLIFFWAQNLLKWCISEKAKCTHCQWHFIPCT